MTAGSFARKIVGSTTGVRRSADQGNRFESQDETVIRLYGGESTGDPLSDAIAANFIVEQRNDLMSNGYTAGQAQQQIQMQQQVGRTSDPFGF